ncbi:uncharacterized protein C19orf47 isoform X2 [Centruroides vittatus]|uniref:uncharacterized protein C19orf47 isoform X2 n=1 Tax=Centruroides vittatus TaxID=120091 RepID=UPI00350EC4DE
MASGMTTSKWIKFFIDSGLPPNVSANYAIIFTDHRIQMDMLLDLSKEYLFDMGIRTLGDVIAILRHAKIAHNQAVKEKMIIVENDQATSSPLRKSTPASRMLDHYTRRVTKPNDSLNESGVRKLTETEKFSEDKNTVISLKRKTPAPPAVKKVRRVLPEHEGTYKVTMPAGTTERTRKILNQQKVESAKRSVFDRLGDSAVSSSTDVSTTKIQNSSVFQRLGPSKTQVTTSSPANMNDDDEDYERNKAISPLPYQGVLKITGIKKTIPSNTIKITKVIRNPDALVKHSAMTKRTSIMKRLGPKPTLSKSLADSSTEPTSLIIKKSIEAATAIRRFPITSANKYNTAGILGNKSNLKRINIKNRLGQKLPTGKTNAILNRTNIINLRNVKKPMSERLGPPRITL